MPLSTRRHGGMYRRSRCCPPPLHFRYGSAGSRVVHRVWAGAVWIAADRGRRMRIELAAGAALASLKRFREESFWRKPKWPLVAIVLWILGCLGLIRSEERR